MSPRTPSRVPASPSLWARARSFLILALATLTCACLLAEAWARAREAPPSPRFDPVDSEGNAWLPVVHELVGGPISYVPRPGASSGVHGINSVGFRGPEWPAGPDADEFRILVLGDSVCFGTGLPIELTMGTMLELILNELEAESRVRVANGCVSGYNTEQEALFLERIGPAVDPDLVLLLVVQNDLAGPSRFELADGRLFAVAHLAPPVPVPEDSPAWLTRAARRSAAIRALLRKTQELGWRGPYEDLSGLEARHDFLESLERVQRTARELGAQTAALVVPRLRADASPEHDRTRASILQGLEEAGFPVMDLAPLFEGLDPAQLRIVRDDDIHLNPLGHFLAAARAAEGLVHDHGIRTGIPPVEMRPWREADGAQKVRLACGLLTYLAAPEIAEHSEQAMAHGPPEAPLGALVQACALPRPPTLVRANDTDLEVDLGVLAFSRIVYYIPASAGTSCLQGRWEADGGGPGFSVPEGFEFAIWTDASEAWSSRPLGSGSPTTGSIRADIPPGSAVSLDLRPLTDEAFGQAGAWMDLRLKTSHRCEDLAPDDRS